MFKVGDTVKFKYGAQTRRVADGAFIAGDIYEFATEAGMSWPRVMNTVFVVSQVHTNLRLKRPDGKEVPWWISPGAVHKYQSDWLEDLELVV